MVARALGKQQTLYVYYMIVSIGLRVRLYKYSLPHSLNSILDTQVGDGGGGRRWGTPVIVIVLSNIHTEINIMDGISD